MVKCSSSSCQHATGSGCVCICGHGNHGAKARIRWAKALSKEASQRSQAERADAKLAEKQRNRAKEVLKSQNETLRQSRKAPRRDDANAFFEANRTIDIVNWLIEHPTTCDQMEWIADQIGEAAENLLLQFPGKHQRIADHFWCDVLAALATILAELLETSNQLIDDTAEAIAEKVWESVKATRNEEKGNAPCQKQRTRKTTSRLRRDYQEGLKEAVLKQTVETLVKKIIKKVVAEPEMTVETFLLQIRLLAILFCPDPYAHRAVWNNCVIPLMEEEIIAKSLEGMDILKRLFEQRWSWDL